MSIQDRRLAEQENRLTELERLVGKNRFTEEDYRAQRGRHAEFVDPGFPIVMAKFTLLRNYTFFHNEF